ncbi:hypothetical protein B0H67DRAFT_687826 [Lasiosphaeris hirsuta]|uniref:Uncharacterized protein n=1 Tax=Lasiosphaeris hirsuta TaxID=260670 RepID=A0AA40DLY9_9PEZI|nr:hypothetical protein B0H67DRAFT_687826 [Lasiosphaeris hirsuta]
MISCRFDLAFIQGQQNLVRHETRRVSIFISPPHTFFFPCTMETSDISQPASDQTYTVTFAMVPPHPPHDTNISYDNTPWGVGIVLEVVNMAMIQKGLSWTTQNLVLLNGQQASYKSLAPGNEYDLPWEQDVVRVWLLREFPGRPVAESRWHGGVMLFAHSAQTLDGFRLGKLNRQLICHASVYDHTGDSVFVFDPEEPGKSKNGLFSSDSEACDLW